MHIDFTHLCNRVQQDGDHINTVAQDLCIKHQQRLGQTGFDICYKTTTILLVRSVLEGAYGRTNAIQLFSDKLVHSKMKVTEMTFEGFEKELCDVMSSTGLVKNGKAKPLNQRNMARQMNAESKVLPEDKWVGQTNLDPISADKTFDLMDCPVCQNLPNSDGAHYLACCPITKAHRYKIVYHKSWDQSEPRNKKNNQPKGGNASVASPNAPTLDTTKPDEDGVSFSLHKSPTMYLIFASLLLIDLRASVCLLTPITLMSIILIPLCTITTINSGWHAVQPPVSHA